MIGHVLAHYEILEKIGEGGMGVVYKARDLQLGRLVALKTLSESVLQNPEQRLRFLQEARAACALNHPNIVIIYEISTAREVHFIAMEYVRGKTLDGLISERSLPLPETIRYAVQIADALAAAHAAGVIHRDLKPANVMITAEGTVKILDFGLAKVDFSFASNGTLEETRSIRFHAATEPGMLLGTVSYMSPEQAESRQLDARSDMFSFGAVLYEMVTGRKAFDGTSGISTLTAILRDEPKPVREWSSGVPHQLQAIISRCLRKDRESRYPSMGDVRAALEQLISAGHPIGTTGPMGSIASGKHSGGSPSIAVLPFTNLSADKENEYFSDGLAEEIINALTRIEGIRVTARTSAFAFRGIDQDVRTIGEKLNVGTILEGSVRRSGKRVRVNAQLVDTTNGFHIWSDRYDRELDDVFAIQDEIAAAIVEKLRVRLVGEADRALVRRHTDNIEAYDFYLKGQYYAHNYTPEALAKSKEYFERAVRQDPDYALAYAGLAFYYGALGWFGLQPPRRVGAVAEEAALKALSIDPDLAEAHALMGVLRGISDLDWAEAEREFRMALELKPASAEIADLYSVHYLVPTGAPDRAIPRLRRALERDPLSVQLQNDLAWSYMLDRQYEVAIREYEKAQRIEPSYYLTQWGLGLSYFMIGRHDEGLAAYERAVELAPGISLSTGVLASGYAIAGRREEAVRMLDQLLEASQSRYVSPVSIAFVFVGLGAHDQAFQWLERAIDERDGPVFALKTSPFYDPLRQDPRYARLLTKLRV
jgi:serine/threonine-protein kinase